MTNLKNQKYVIVSKLKPGKYLAGLGLGSCNPLFPDVWTSYSAKAMRCTNTEAGAIIKFIREVVDETLGNSLDLVKFKSKEPWEEKSE